MLYTRAKAEGRLESYWAWTPINQEQFPDRTLHMTAAEYPLCKDHIEIYWKYENDAELFSLICLRKHYSKYKDVVLYMPYCPHARMDLEWAEANEWETPICLAGDLQQAIELVKKELKGVKE